MDRFLVWKKKINEITVEPEKNKDSNECRPTVSLKQSESEIQVESKGWTHEAIDQISRSSCFSSLKMRNHITLEHLTSHSNTCRNEH